jgi:phosphoglycerate dehydrogenase-like enzyme
MDAARIARMKPGAILINCARGELVDDAALLQALESGHLSGAGLDVYAVEPPRDNPLLKSDRVVLTPHLAGATSNNFTNVVERAVKNAIACLAGQPLPAADLVSAK